MKKFKFLEKLIDATMPHPTYEPKTEIEELNEMLAILDSKKHLYRVAYVCKDREIKETLVLASSKQQAESYFKDNIVLHIDQPRY